MAFNPSKVTVRLARPEAVYDEDAAKAAGLKVSNGVVAPTVAAVTRLLEQRYSREDLYLDSDTGLMVFGDVVGAEALTDLIKELEVVTRAGGWYEKRGLVADVITRRPRSPHAARLIEIPKDLPVADLSPWTELTEDPAFTDEALRLMVYGYTLRAFRPGSKFDYTIIMAGNEGIGKTTLFDALFPGRTVGYDYADSHAVETAAECERIVLEEASEELFRHDRFNAFKDRVTLTERGEDQKYVRGKTQMRVRAIYTGTSNERYLLHSGLQGTRRILPIVVRRDVTTLMPRLTKDVWEQLISEALRRFDDEMVPVLSPEGAERQQMALAYVTRPDDDGELLTHVISELIADQGYFQKRELQEELLESDPHLARNPAFGRAWRKVQHDYRQVSSRINGKSTKVFVPVVP